jgi:hypothetical protein
MASTTILTITRASDLLHVMELPWGGTTGVQQDLWVEGMKRMPREETTHDRAPQKYWGPFVSFIGDQSWVRKLIPFISAPLLRSKTASRSPNARPVTNFHWYEPNFPPQRPIRTRKHIAKRSQQSSLLLCFALIYSEYRCINHHPGSKFQSDSR